MGMYIISSVLQRRFLDNLILIKIQNVRKINRNIQELTFLFFDCGILAVGEGTSGSVT